MKEEALKKILDREGPKADVERHFQNSVELLREVVNYGTNLIPRAYKDSKRDLTAAVIQGGVLKQAVAMLDAVEILVSQGAVLAAHVPARSLLEIYFFILWILQSDTDKRAKQYYVWTLRQRRMWAKRLIPGTDENRDFQTSLERIAAIPPEKLQEAQDEAKTINSLLAQDEYRPISEEFDNLRRKSRRSYDPAWYRPWGPNSIGDMARKLNRGSEHKVFYARLSDVTHSTAFQEHVRFKDDILVFEPIRHLKEIKTVISITVTLALGIYRSILTHYRFGELENFKLKYINEWRERFWSIADVGYRTIHGDPI